MKNQLNFSLIAFWESARFRPARVWIGRSIFTAVLLMSFASIALCCSIPVFRYALEHWKPESLIVHVLSDKPLNDTEKTYLLELERLSPDANVRIKLSEGKNGTKLATSLIGQTIANRNGPWLVVEQLRRGEPSQVVWDCPLTSESLKGLLISPLRQKVCEGLVDRDSVSWVFLESGDRQTDDAKFQLLETELLRLETTIKLPVIDQDDLKDLSKKPEELKLRFSAHRLSRNEPTEATLVSMLLATEPDLREEFEKGMPMAFPIFGRGRVLYALLGDGISASTIEEASRFLAGACQCTVKADNPGIDLLIAFDWDARVQITELKKDNQDMPLTGLGVVTPPFAQTTEVQTDTTKNILASESAVTVAEIRDLNPMLPTHSASWKTLGLLAAILTVVSLGWVFLHAYKGH